MFKLGRAVVSHVVNVAVFVVITFGGIAAGTAICIAEDVETEIKKRIGSHRR